MKQIKFYALATAFMTLFVIPQAYAADYISKNGTEFEFFSHSDSVSVAQDDGNTVIFRAQANDSIRPSIAPISVTFSRLVKETPDGISGLFKRKAKLGGTGSPLLDGAYTPVFGVEATQTVYVKFTFAANTKQ